MAANLPSLQKLNIAVSLWNREFFIVFCYFKPTSITVPIRDSINTEYIRFTQLEAHRLTCHEPTAVLPNEVLFDYRRRIEW